MEYKRLVEMLATYPLTDKQRKAVLLDWDNGLAGLDTRESVMTHTKGILSGVRHWWVLDEKGTLVDPATFGSRPEGSYPAGDDPYTPYQHIASHLHGENGCDGIHVLGTLAQAQAELKKAQDGKSLLPCGDKVV